MKERQTHRLGRIAADNRTMLGLAWKGSRSWVVFTMLDTIINPLRNLTIDVLFIGYIYNAVGNGASLEAMTPFFIGLLMYYLLNILFEAVSIVYVYPEGEVKIDAYIDRYLMEIAAKAPLSAYDDAAYFEEYTFSVQNCSDTVKHVVYDFSNLIAYSLGSIFSLALILGIEPVMAVFIGISLIFSYLITSRKNQLAVDYQTALAPIQVKEQYVHRTFYLPDYAKELRCFEKLPVFLMKMFHETEAEKIGTTRLFGRKSLRMNFLQTLNQRGIMYWLVMLLITFLIFFRGDIQPGNIMIMTISIGTAALYFMVLANTLPNMAKTCLYMDKLRNFAERAKQSDIEATKAAAEFPGGISSIRFDHVTFTYPNESAPTLKGLTFELRRDETAAIVGRNGAGKSTILKLLLKFYIPDEGTIWVNNKNIQDLDETSYHSFFSIILQDFNAYAFSLQKNLSLSEAPVDRQAMGRALEAAGLPSLIDHSSAELTKEFDGNGLMLSGGELQKLAIARAVYKDAPILIFDEITSALDPESEFEIMQRIREAGKGKLVLAISHKLSCVKDASKILFIEDGCIRESASHEELIRQKGRYYQLFQQQEESFIKQRNAEEKERWTI